MGNKEEEMVLLLNQYTVILSRQAHEVNMAFLGVYEQVVSELRSLLSYRVR